MVINKTTHLKVEAITTLMYNTAAQMNATGALNRAIKTLVTKLTGHQNPRDNLILIAVINIQKGQLGISLQHVDAYLQVDESGRIL